MPTASDTDCKVLRMAVSHLREERMAQLRLLQEQKRRLEAELSMTAADGAGSPLPAEAAAVGGAGDETGNQDVGKPEPSPYSPKIVGGARQTEPEKRRGDDGCDSAACPPEGDAPRDSQSNQTEEKEKREGSLPASDRDDRPNAADATTLLPPPPPHQHQHLQGLLPHPQPHPSSRPPGYHFPPGPLASLAGIQGLLGPSAVWSGGATPPGAVTWGPRGQQQPLLWYPPLVGGYHGTAAGQSGSRYRGGQRGGGYHSM